MDVDDNNSNNNSNNNNKAPVLPDSMRIAESGYANEGTDMRE